MSANIDNNQHKLPERFCLDVVREYIAANWVDFSNHAKAYAVDPSDLYQQIGGEEIASDETFQ